jgi:PhoH-like ATPase
MKYFVLDTNVLLYDPNSLFSFGDATIVLPLVVLEELDSFKNGTQHINFCARTVIKNLNKIIKDSFKINNFGGSLLIDTVDYKIDHIDTKVDNKIIALVKHYKDINHDITLITKDIALKIKATGFGLSVENFESESRSTIDFPGWSEIVVDDNIIDMIYDSAISSTLLPNELVPNQYLLLKSNTGSSPGLAYYNADKKTLEKVTDIAAAGVKPQNLEQIFALDALLNDDIKLVALTGTSGSGKTLLSLAAALERKKNYIQIYLAKPPIPVGKDIGYLPGNLKEKLDPYMQSFYDNLEVIKSINSKLDVTKLLTEEKIKVAAIPYMRGRSLPRIWFVIDEVQNMTPHEIKTIITRAGEGTKIVLLGDLTQIDSPYLDQNSNGLIYVINKFAGQSIFSHIDLKKSVRSRLAELASRIL